MKRNFLYALPKPENGGGMTEISLMFYQYGIFEKEGYYHFDTTFTIGNNKLLRLFQSVLLKFKFYKFIKKNDIDVVFVMTSSYMGFYDKCIYCFIARMMSKYTPMSNMINEPLTPGKIIAEMAMAPAIKK